jgi:carbon-monoxide dehydrogenase large subunit
MLALGHGRGQVQTAELGGRRDGTLTHYRLNVIQDAGAYARLGSVLPFLTRTMINGAYAIPAIEFNAASVVTNTAPIVAYRGAGRPEATAAIERMVDLFAAEIGMDPAEVRRRNFVDPGAFPYTNPVGTVYDVGDYADALTRALELAGYDDLRAEQQRRRDAGDRTALGIGLSTYVEITGHLDGKEFGAVTITPEGGAVVRAGTSAHGQGHATAFAMIVSEELGIPVEDVRLVQSDTDAVPFGLGTMGSRSLQAGGSAVRQAALQVKEQAEALRADKGLGADASWADLAAAAGDGGLAAEKSLDVGTPSFPYGAHVAVVEVDVDTGKVTLVRHVAVDDAGRILNPLMAEGQIHGGIAQGVAQALLEEMSYDADGNPVTANLADYAFISAAELPSFETAFTEHPTPSNELGVKGIGESGTIGATPAVQNAVVDALAHLGVRHLDMPASPQRVWETLRSAGGRS